MKVYSFSFQGGKTLFLILVLFLTFSIEAKSDTKTYFGFGLGLQRILEDSRFDQNSRSIVKPITGGDFYYYSVNIPQILIKEDERLFQIGFSGSSITNKDIRIEDISDTVKVKYYQEVSWLSFYLTYLFTKRFFNFFDGYLLIGPTLTEAVLVDVVQEYELLKNSQGIVYEDTDASRIQKKYYIDYSLGAVAGSGVYYDVSENNLLGLQLNLFINQTKLQLDHLNNISTSSVELQFNYLYAF
ncbi:MAG: hypothetical protein OEY59_13100 [Deltaproteobacteria bacterium]|nr:hypothetical protein [Deltaproteobacteria bacterium]